MVTPVVTELKTKLGEMFTSTLSKSILSIEKAYEHGYADGYKAATTVERLLKAASAHDVELELLDFEDSPPRTVSTWRKYVKYDPIQWQPVAVSKNGNTVCLFVAEILDDGTINYTSKPPFQKE
jgi:hypothetical protein